ncbi:MAG TPA: haloacid dehalogenase type II [Candidatus Limnocylindrales bacterium]|nr:haloacid dehalogenase type II [Candidatus Limnocylindrales bacterium]
MFAFDRFAALTFDCYGTLIDWETGILDALRPIFAAHGVDIAGEELLEGYATAEAAAEAGPYRPYRQVLREVLAELAARYGFEPSQDELATFAESVGDWPAFPDSADALAALKRRFRLAVVTNCDDDLFARSNARLGVTFDAIVTAQQARAYKPALAPFELAFDRLALPRERVLHVAQSLYHDHVPAKRLGITTVWVNRRHGRPGTGATPPAEAAPDLIVPDMRSLAELALTPAS